MECTAYCKGYTTVRYAIVWKMADHTFIRGMLSTRNVPYY
jgi:hypothetical protein